MKKVVLFFAVALVWNGLFAQINRTWNGSGIPAYWNNPNNWLPIGVPATGDTVIFNSVTACDLNVSPSIAALRATGTGGNIITGSGPQTMTIGNAGAVPSVLRVDAGANLSLGNGGGISFTTYGAGGANTAQIAGTLNLLGTSTWAMSNGAGQLTNTDVTGTVNVTAFHTGPTAITNSIISTLRFLSGSTLAWARNGG